ncbi:MAG: hypothetical protein H0X63_11870 [Flavobacteriales bacterium]|nr:hypothetical protein [Flavobacteriales bacterium]
MRDLELFYQLKEKVLQAYRERYPFFQGDWKTFGSRDIQNLIDAIEKETRQTISEKWIYTHLKPESNDKLPRKDMLDILSFFVGYTGWDEFQFKNNVVEVASEKKRPLILVWIIAGIITTGIITYGIINTPGNEQNTTETIEEPGLETEESELIENESEAVPQQDNNLMLKAEENTTEIKTIPTEEPKKKGILLGTGRL